MDQPPGASHAEPPHPPPDRRSSIEHCRPQHAEWSLLRRICVHNLGPESGTNCGFMIHIHRSRYLSSRRCTVAAVRGVLHLGRYGRANLSGESVGRSFRTFSPLGRICRAQFCRHSGESVGRSFVATRPVCCYPAQFIICNTQLLVLNTKFLF